jgi:predicted DNA-binding transcriptional regulator AlpA
MELRKTIVDFYTISNFSKKFNISRPTIYRRIEDKELEVLIIDGVTFVKPK